MESRLTDDAAIENDDDPAAKRRKSMPNTSFIWKHFQRSEDKKSIACLHCLPTGATVFAYSGGTSTMTRHLRRKHGIFAPGKSEQDYERPSSNAAPTMLTSFFDKSDDGGGTTPTDFHRNPTKVAGHSATSSNPSRWIKLQHTRHTRQWIQYATTQYASLTLDTDMHALLRKNNGMFEPLQGPPLVTALMELMQAQRAALKEYLDVARPSMALSVDMWPSASNCSVHVVTGHWITEDFQLRECVLDCTLVPTDNGRGDGDLAQAIIWLHSTIDQWGVDVVAMTVKPSWNTPSFARAFPDVAIVPCLVHQVNSVMQTVLSVFSSLLAKARRLVLAAPLAGVHLDHPMHWSSSLSMLQQPFVLNHSSWTPDDAQRVHHAVSILGPVHALLQQIAASATNDNTSPPLASLAFALLHGAVKLLQDKLHAAPFVPLLQSILLSPLLRRVCSLDPRFKSLPFLTPAEKQDTLDSLQRAVSSKAAPDFPSPPRLAPATSAETASTPCQPPPTTTCSSWTELYPFEQAQPPGDLQTYLDATAPAAHDLDDPLAWWKVHRHVYPHLAQAARKHLIVSPCASNAAEVLGAPDVVGRKQAIPTGLVAAYLFVRSALRVPEIVTPDKSP